VSIVQETQKPKKLYREVSANLSWQAVYLDKTINQYNPDASQNSYDGLNREGMTAFNLVNDKGEVVVTVPLDLTKKLFYRMRVALLVGSHCRERIWLVGWRKSDGSMRVWVVDSKGKVKTYRNFREDSQWLYAPEFRSFEEV